MIEIVLFVTIVPFAVFGFETCFKELGNMQTSHDPIHVIEDSTYDLSQCKETCDQWKNLCDTYQPETLPDCRLRDCIAGTLKDTGCYLYQENGDWYANENNLFRYESFAVCDVSCWEDWNGQEVNSNEYVIELSEEKSIHDCQALCINHNGSNPASFCYGVEYSYSSSNCKLLHEGSVDELQFSNDEGTHVREYTCPVLSPDESEVDETGQDDALGQSSDSYDNNKHR